MKINKTQKLESLADKATQIIFLTALIAIAIIFAYQNNTSLIHIETNKLFEKNIAIINTITSLSGYIITTLGFYFVVIQISTLSKQISIQEKQHQQETEFKNFLDSINLLSSKKSKAACQISALYLLYDSAIRHPGANLEKVMRVMNNLILSHYEIIEKSESARDIEEWKENGDHLKKVTSIALDLIKRLFIFALTCESNRKIELDLSGIIIFNLDVEQDLKPNKRLSITHITRRSKRMKFIHCKFACSRGWPYKSTIYFSTSRNFILKKSLSELLNISLSDFIDCNLSYCDFSNSNLWGVLFKECNLDNMVFNDAECEGVAFEDNISELTDIQLKSMSFSKNKYKEYNRLDITKPPIKYGIIYPLRNDCFESQEEYKHYKDWENS